MSLTAGYQKFLSLGFIASSKVLNHAMTKIEWGNFNREEDALKVIFKLAGDWYTKYETLIPPAYMMQVIEAENIPGMLGQDKYQELIELVAYAYDSSGDAFKMEEHLLNVLSEFLQDRQVTPLLAQLATSNNIAAALLDLQDVQRNCSIKKVVSWDPFSVDIPLTCGDKRELSGCDFWDSVTGGSVRGETTLVLACSGGGKTLTNIQLACSYALTGQHSLILSYEQIVFPGISNRVYSYALAKSLKLFEGKSREEFEEVLRQDPELAQKWQDVKKKLAGYLHLVDMQEVARAGGAKGGPSDIEDIIKDKIAAGINIKYVGLDWFGPFVETMAAGKNLLTKSAIMDSAMKKLSLLSSRYNVNFVVFHQLGTGVAASAPSVLPKMNDSFECKSLCNHADTVVCIGTRCPTSNLAYICVPKQRSGNPHQKACIRLDGAHAKWVYVSERVITDDYGNLIPVTGVEDGAEEPLDTFKKKINASVIGFTG